MFKLDINTIYYPSIKLIKNPNQMDNFNSDLHYILTTNHRRLVIFKWDITPFSISILIDVGNWIKVYSFHRVAEYLRENHLQFKWVLLRPSESDENEIIFNYFNNEQEFLDAIIKDTKTYREEYTKQMAEEKAKQTKEKTDKNTFYDDAIECTNSIIWERHYASSNESRSWDARIQNIRTTRINSLIEESYTDNAQIQWTVNVNMQEQQAYYFDTIDGRMVGTIYQNEPLQPMPIQPDPEPNNIPI